MLSQRAKVNKVGGPPLPCAFLLAAKILLKCGVHIPCWMCWPHLPTQLERGSVTPLFCWLVQTVKYGCCSWKWLDRA
ncbi:hypothetical protein VIGAN_UM046000 [Vigna angularis var. angularis]|uniref:Uncharacterized protein n=1 Tax=Vigna angularis var. angularis TaxID=157739 RepID=A0A0S3TDL4_PHAAN|nr:hypothetical protein VIGAN_UM046000 [Vigna angularis var. angularis]